MRSLQANTARTPSAKTALQRKAFPLVIKEVPPPVVTELCVELWLKVGEVDAEGVTGCELVVTGISLELELEGAGRTTPPCTLPAELDDDVFAAFFM